MTQKGKILVTGSSGFIGREVTRQAKELGYEVAGLDRVEPRNGAERPHTFIRKDVNHLTRKDLSRCRFVIHLAAEVTPQRIFEQNLFDNFTTNITAFLNIIELSKHIGVKSFVYASSSAVYGRYMHLDPEIVANGVKENIPIDYKTEQNHYGKSKMMNEMIAQSYHDTHGMTNIGLRIMNAWDGAGETSKGISACAPTQMMRQRSAGLPIEVYGDGTQAKDFIYVTDCANIILQLMEKAGDGVYNIGTGIATNFNRIAELIGGEIAHVPNPNVYYPMLTKGNMEKTLGVIGPYNFITMEEGMRMAGRPRK